MENNKIIEFYNNFLPHLKQDHAGNNQRLAKVKTKLSQLVKKDMTILDIGCGTGITSKFMAQLGGKVTAVDIAPKLIEYAKKESKHKNVKYICQDVTTLDLKKTFDLIVIVDCLEHITEEKIWWPFIDVIRRHTNKKTIIFLNIPAAQFQKYMKEYHPGRLQIIDEVWSYGKIIFNFNEINFEPIEIEIYGIDVPCQYNNYTFIHKKRLALMYKEGLVKIKN